MENINDEIIRILKNHPPESSTLDYKEIPYKFITLTKHDTGVYDDRAEFIKDVIALLNSKEGLHQSKALIFGVTNDGELVGLPNEIPDNNYWQHVIEVISPEPDVLTANVHYEGKIYGYVYIYPDNIQCPYEVGKDIAPRQGNDGPKLKAYESFQRHASNNEPLSESGRQELRELVKGPNFPSDFNIAMAATLCGQWLDDSKEDQTFIESLSGMSYESFVKGMYPNAASPNGAFIYNSFKHSWRLRNIKSVSPYLSKSLFVEHFKRFIKNLNEVFTTSSKVSEELQIGITRTLAIIGNIDSYSQLEQNFVKSNVYSLVMDIFNVPDIEIIRKAFSKSLYISQASPKAFLKSVSNLWEGNPQVIEKLFSENSILPNYSTNSLCSALKLLASDKIYFAQAISLLIELSALNIKMIDYAAAIVSPIFPQTQIPISVQIKVLEANLYKYPKEVWTVIEKVVFRHSRHFIPPEPAEHIYITHGEFQPQTIPNYEKAMDAYIQFAISISNDDISKIISLTKTIDKVNIETQDKIISAIKSKLPIMSNSEKEHLWDLLEDKITLYSNNSKNNWYLTPARLQSLKTLQLEILPNSEKALARQSFRNIPFLTLNYRNYSTPEEFENAVNNLRISALKKLIANDVFSLFSFAASVERPDLVGQYSYSLLSFSEIQRILEKTKNFAQGSFTSGLVFSIPDDEIISICQNFDPLIQAKILALHPYTSSILNAVRKFPKEPFIYYWNNVGNLTTKITNASELEYISKNLIDAGRYLNCIIFLRNQLNKGKSVLSSTFICDTLIDIPKKVLPIPNSGFYIQELIKYLQSNSCDSEKICRVEWKFLSILETDRDCQPKYLYKKLAKDPEYFLLLIEKIHGKNQVSLSTPEGNAYFSKCWFLLNKWKNPPGLISKDTFDSLMLNQWHTDLSKLLSRIEDSYIISKANYYFGRVLFYSPNDPDGFFLLKSVAQILENNKSILSGYENEAKNGNHVYVIEDNQTLDQTAADYTEKAQKAYENGYYNIGNALMTVSEYYGKTLKQMLKD